MAIVKWARVEIRGDLRVFVARDGKDARRRSEARFDAMEMEIGDFFSGRRRYRNRTLTRHGNDADEDGRLERIGRFVEGRKRKKL